ncbi:MAG TPA: DUF488 domain-containing protein [Candidatus Binataceae bacterium]|nr:DUF488 domain-containing protein [Candidatus Binataceae bacterium]
MPPTPRPLKLPSRSARKQAESKALFNEARDAATANFFTLGYSGRTAQDVVDLLTGAGVRSVIDIRFTPISMYRPEFSRRNFKRLIEAAGFQYLHVPGLGVPRDIRAKALATGNRETIWEWYDTYRVEPFLRNLHDFLNLEHPVALMCVEADPRECHRHRLFQALENHGLRGFDL